MCVNHPNILAFQKLRSPLVLFGLKSFHGFAILGGKIEPIACLCFVWSKKSGKIFQKAISNMESSSKKKTLKWSNDNRQ